MPKNSSRRLQYEPVPNMAGLSAEQSTAAREPLLPEPPASRPKVATAKPQKRKASDAKPQPDKKVALSAAPARVPARRGDARAKSVVTSEERLRRTLRLPRSFDKMLRELAAVRGQNLNSALLAAIENEWRREVGGRKRR